MKSASFEILAYEDTSLGVLCLRRRELLREPGKVITEITLNHEFLMSSYNTESECALSEIALELHPGHSLKVLVGGLGLGYTAHAVLKSKRVAQVQVVEFLPQVIDWLKSGLVPLSCELNAEDRLEILQGDLYKKLLAACQQKYDLILIDIDHSPTEKLSLENSHDTFYTQQGLKQVMEHLECGGILGVWSYAEHPLFEGALRSVFREVRVEGISFENKLVHEKHTDWLFFARK